MVDQVVVDHIYFLLSFKKIKKAAINPKNNNDTCFLYVVAVALNH